jgi:predicted AAA+ superfamily ATPase
MFIKRYLDLNSFLKNKSILFLGPRRTGKTHYILNQLKPDIIYDLLDSRQFLRLSQRPFLIEEEIKNNNQIVVIDEIQKLPILMDQVHRLIESKNIKFVLTGSSARKLKRTHTSLMAGRAKIISLMPFVYPEIKDFGFDIERIIKYGALPPIFLSSNPKDELIDYVYTYIKEEIQYEAMVRNIESFSRFLNVAALSNAELINFTQISSDSGVKQRTVIEYFKILEDTLIGNLLIPYKSEKERKIYSRAKFYFFDIGVVNSILNRFDVVKGTSDFGKLFEHFIFNELSAYKSYTGKIETINFWRDYYGNEVDFIINGEILIEVKSKDMVVERDIKGIYAFSKKHSNVKRKIVVSFDLRKRFLKDIEIIPYKEFLELLWNNEIL